MARWLTHDVLLISLSAFFADAGYQALIAGFPIFLVIYLKQPVYLLGIAMGLAYGGGSLFAFVGGYIADRWGKKRTAITGNLLIPILSLTGLVTIPAEAIGLFSGGWWARNFRSPARRAMMGDISASLDRSKVYGFLNALDVSGGIIAVIYLSIGIYLGIAIGTIFLITIIPILVSSVCLLLVKYKGMPNVDNKPVSPKEDYGQRDKVSKTYRAVLLATAIYGISFYSLSFPVLTIAQESTDLYGILSYALFLVISAIFGYVAGIFVKKKITGLAFFGYMLAGIGSALIGLSYFYSLGFAFSYLGVAVVGIAVGSIETLEPTIISLSGGVSSSGRRMGSLTASRSVGLFLANIILGFLYFYNAAYAYTFAAVAAITASLVLIAAGIKSPLNDAAPPDM